jgi:hypothetical protein
MCRAGTELPLHSPRVTLLRRLCREVLTNQRMAVDRLRRVPRQDEYRLLPFTSKKR